MKDDDDWLVFNKKKVGFSSQARRRQSPLKTRGCCLRTCCVPLRRCTRRCAFDPLLHPVRRARRTLRMGRCQ